MTVKDPEKNRLYVAKHRAMKKENQETKKEYNALNASYIANHRNKQKEELGIDEFKKNNAEYMRQYRAKQKQIKDQTKTANATTIQNAIRNKLARNTLLRQKETNNATTIQTAIRSKLARNALLRQKQDIANEIVSKINQERQAQDQEQTYNKLFASVFANNIANSEFDKWQSYLPEQAPKKRGRPLGSKSKKNN